MKSNADVDRKAALQEWCARFSDFERALAALHIASEDRRLIRGGSRRDGNDDGITLDALCIHIQDVSLPGLVPMVNQLRSVLSALKSVQNLSPALVPIHRLPPELMHCIFNETWDSCVETEWPYKVQQKISAQSPIPHVCRLWRAIFHDPATFRTPLTFDDAPNFTRTSHLVRLAEGSRVSLAFDFSDNPVLHNHIRSAISATLPSVSRKCSLRLRGSPSHLHQFMKEADSVTIHYAAFECLIITPEGKDKSFPAKAKGFVQKFTNLRDLQLKGVGIDWSLGVFKNIAMLKLHDISPPSTEQFDKMLRACLNLQTLDLKFLPTKYPPSKGVSAEGYTLPNLQAVSLMNVPVPILRQFFSRVRLPFLRSLRVDCEIRDLMHDVISFVHCIRPPSLECLEICYWLQAGKCAWESIIRLLWALPMLKQLRFTFVRIGEPILQALAPGGGGSFLVFACPRLEELHLHFVTGCAPFAVSSMVEARKYTTDGQFPPLRVLFVYKCDANDASREDIAEAGLRCRACVGSLMSWWWGLDDSNDTQIGTGKR
jgi:hypothetical protein